MRFSYGRASLIGFGLCCSKTWVQIQCSRVVDSVSAGSKSCNFCTFAYPVTQSPCSDPNIHECTTLMAAVRPLAGSLPEGLPKPGFPSQNPSLSWAGLHICLWRSVLILNLYHVTCAEIVQLEQTWNLSSLLQSLRFPIFLISPQKTRKLRHFGPKINNGNFTNGVTFCVLSWKFYPSPKIFYTNVICDFFDNFHVWSWTEVLSYYNI